MSISKTNLRLSGLSVQSNKRPTASKVNHRVCEIFLAGLILFGGGAKADNVLVNPGAETGDLTGWHVSNTGDAFASPKFYPHSGSWSFELFDTTGDSAFIYQDYAAVAGSQWSASCYAICYAANYFNPGANAHMQVAFYDISNHVVVSPDSSSVTAGVYGSDFLDPSGSPFYWIFAPPMAVDASGWLFLQPTNLYNTDPATESSFEVPLSPITTTLTAPIGTAFIRYQLEFDYAGTAGGAVFWDDCILDKLNFSDPDITNPPVSVTIIAGSSATFTVGALHAMKSEVLTYQWQITQNKLPGTNLPPAGGVYDIDGPTTNSTLSFTNCQQTDDGLYSVVVSDTNGSIRSVPVALTVLTYTPPPPVGNWGFEDAPNWSPWNIFNGSSFASSNNVYGASTTPVNVFDGNWCALVGDNGDRDNGFYRTLNAAPGTVWKAGGWAYISSLNDFVGGNTCRIEIWFKDTFGNYVPNTPTYESFKIYGLGYINSDAQYANIDTSSPNFGVISYHAQLPRDQWVFLPVTNAVNNSGIGPGDDLPTNTLPNGLFMVPTNANVAEINFQVYEYCPASSDNPQPDLPGIATDAVYWDDMELVQILPVTDLAASINGSYINLSFSAAPGLDYTILYKTNLTDATWSMLTNNITSSGTTITTVTISDPITAESRFYRVQVQ